MQIKDHEKTFDRNSLRDLVDQYLAEIPWEKDIKEKSDRLSRYLSFDILCHYMYNHESVYNKELYDQIN